MRKIDLKSFDIASYDIELEFKAKIAPISKKIEKLNSEHEAKSLKAHKDFLKKEKKSKEIIEVFSEKAILKEQRIEKAVENKITRQKTHEKKLEKELKEFKKKELAAKKSKITVLNKEIKALNKAEDQDKVEVHERYKGHVESYVEKLETYNNNYKNNVKINDMQVDKYTNLVTLKLAEIENFRILFIEEMTKNLNEFIIAKKSDNNDSAVLFNEAKKELNHNFSIMKKQANGKIKKIKSEIENLQHTHQERFKKYLDNVQSQIELMKNEFDEHKQLIEKDLEINLHKSISSNISFRGESLYKTIKRKTDLFNLRASTTISYEERVLNEKILLFEEEISLLNEISKNEVKNIEKLGLHLINDQKGIIDSGEYFRDFNTHTKKELTNLETSNNKYLIKHEKLKEDFIKGYHNLFDKFKKNIISLNKSAIEQLTVINRKIDELNKYLETSEPLKEIEVNKLRENIEIAEVIERYKIKYAQMDHELQLLESESLKKIEIEEINTKNLVSENKMHIAKIKNQETSDKAVEKAKLKLHNGEEVYKLRLNNAQLERNILKSRYDTELDIYDLEMRISNFEIEKSEILILKEISTAIIGIETEANYKIEVINKHLEEDLLKYDEKVSRLKYDQDSYASKMQLLITQEKQNSEKIKNDIINDAHVRISKIEEAFIREIKGPTFNISKSEGIINERLNKLFENNINFNEFTLSNTKLLFESNLTIEQVLELTTNDAIVFNKVSNYIKNTYNSLKEAIIFMSDNEKKSITDKIAEAKDPSTVKKLTKQLEKIDIDNKKKFNSMNVEKTTKEIQIKSQIKSNILKLKNQKINNFKTLKEIVSSVYDGCFVSLKELQAIVIKEIRVLYGPLTQKERDLIRNMELNFKKAKVLVENEKNLKIKPIESDLNILVAKLIIEEKTYLENLDEEIRNINENFSSLQQVALDEAKRIISEKDSLIKAKNDQLRSIDASENTEMVTSIESIQNKKNDLMNLYNNSLNRLNIKEDEAKMIFDYEQRIYNIALETAKTRFNETDTRINNKYLVAVKESEQKVEKILKEFDKLEKKVTKDLINLITGFEKNIYTTRPSLEGAIGDAQRAIEKDIKQKRKLLSSKYDSRQDISQSLENELIISFNTGYHNLLLNLNSYINKFEVIFEEYNSSNVASNEFISNHNNAFTEALFELANKKHDVTETKIASMSIKNS